jgi:hypothetical protein
MQDEDGKNTKVTGASYFHMVKHVVWPEVRNRARRHKWWFQQDGAPVHVTRETIDFVERVFEGRIISQNSDIGWPPYSPDLTPLDYFFWSYALAKVVCRQPEDINKLKSIVEEVTKNIVPEIVHSAVANLMKRVALCLESGGGHFEFAMD